MGKQTFTAKEAMAELGISRSSFYRLTKDGKLHAVKVGTKILVPRWAIAQFLGEDPNGPAK
jgi:excisionase family DNA binding protein